MNISLFDILSKLIPGGLLYFVINQTIVTEKIEISQIVILFLVYILGYLVDSFASIIERPVIFKLFGGNPATKLLQGKGFSKVKIGRLSKLNTHIEQEFKTDTDNKLRLFTIFHSIVSKKGYKRVNDFLEQYVFSRNILISYVLSGMLFLFKHFD